MGSIPSQVNGGKLQGEKPLYPIRRSTMPIRRRNTRRTTSKPKYKRLYKVVCAGCAKEMKLEVPPPAGKNLYCFDCYKKQETSLPGVSEVE